MKKTHLIAVMCLSLTSFASTKTDQAPDPYADTPMVAADKGSVPLRLDPATINVVSGNLGSSGANLQDSVMNYMSLWMAAKAPGPCRIEWVLRAPAAGRYGVTAVAVGKGSRLMVRCNGETLEANVQEEEWSRLDLGTIPLQAGDNSVTVIAEAVKGFKFSSLELTVPTVEERLQAEAMTMRQQPDWFKDAGYGLMFQWTNRATPPKGPIKAWEDKINDFDVVAFADRVEAMGAAYVLWSITWGQQYLSAPIESLVGKKQNETISDETRCCYNPFKVM